MEKKISVYCINNNKCYEFKGGCTLLDIYSVIDYKSQLPPLCALVNNKVEGLTFHLYASKKVEYLTIASNAGRRVYIRSLCMLMFKAIKELYPHLTLRIEHSVSKGYFCTIYEGDRKVAVTSGFIETILSRMKEDVGKDIPFIPHELLKEDAIEVFRQENLKAKVKLLNTLHELYINVYSCEGITDSYYGPLAPSTGYLTVFDIHKHEDGFLLMGPDPVNYFVAPEPSVQTKMFAAFTEHQLFNKIIGVRNIGELNTAIIEGRSSQLINVAEALHANKISSIALEIANRYRAGGARIVLVAGPSSSGKTTTAQRLAIYLFTNLLRPVTISLDNYFVNRDDTPEDETGDKDFEHINALDLKLFNNHLKLLLAGEEVELPYYNFETGKREYRGEKIKLGEGGILLIEGIHGLNPLLTSEIPEEMKFRVYVSALTTLSIDDHNWIPTTDNRLLRRIIRDYKYRGTSAQETIRRWPSVRRGEEKWIFPYQENADALFNSSLLFELAVMKEYGETILKKVHSDSVEYAEAYRLRKFLNYFEPIPDNLIPPTSLLREFLGGSSLNY